MSLLDDETLREVGRFATEFNGLDELITGLAWIILECKEWKVAERLSDNLTAGRRVERIKEVVEILAAEHGLVDSDPYKALKAQIALAKEIVSQRNAVVHGELTIRCGERPSVQLKKQTLELTPRVLSGLIRRINSVQTACPMLTPSSW